VQNGDPRIDLVVARWEKAVDAKVLDAELARGSSSEYATAGE
jgi:hypothetical protein